jgi:predicted O-methyltransferase YrrM
MSISDSGTSQIPLKRRLRRLRRTISSSIHTFIDTLRGRGDSALNRAKAESPLLLAEKTYNTAHPDYEPELVGNYPDRIQNPERPCSNPLFLELRRLATGNKVPLGLWRQVHLDVMEEVSAVPGFSQVMERKNSIDTYLTELGHRYGSHYLAGWVNMTDAQFLYWVVRRTKPKVIVQTGVSNGLSSAFMMLALAKNGPQGRLHVIDLPAIFDPNEPKWTRAGTVYGFVIPQGKSSGWMVPDIYRDRFDVQIGDAKVLLPALVDRLDQIDLFYHDSDHTYNHMTFEFEEAERKLAPNGLVIADDISWNASLWDFADRHRLPSYNYCGSMGIAFNSKTN